MNKYEMIVGYVSFLIAGFLAVQLVPFMQVMLWQREILIHGLVFFVISTFTIMIGIAKSDGTGKRELELFWLLVIATSFIFSPIYTNYLSIGMGALILLCLLVSIYSFGDKI